LWFRGNPSGANSCKQISRARSRMAIRVASVSHPC
jgi:hypothetical protein